MFIFSIATLSIMIFYSAIIAVKVHKTLDRENAGKLLRVLFPSYFLTTAILSLIALIFSLIEKEFRKASRFECFDKYYSNPYFDNYCINKL